MPQPLRAGAVLQAARGLPLRPHTTTPNHLWPTLLL